MQSTKEEYHFTKTFLTQQQQTTAQKQWQSGVQYIGSGDMEKLLVVLLVAFGTVCLLTNLLVLSILVKLCSRGKIPFRYRIIISQSLTGILTSTVLIFPLKMLSLLLVEYNTPVSTVTPSPSPQQISSSLFSSQSTCIVLCSAPLVFAAVSSCLHTVVLYMEQAVRHFSTSNYKVLVSSRHNRLLTLLAAALWLPALSLAFLPALGKGWFHWKSEGDDFCGVTTLWTPDYSNAVLSTYLFLAAMLVSSSLAIKLAGRCAKKRHFSANNKWNRRQGGFEDNLPLCPGTGGLGGNPKRRYKATLIIRTVEPTPLDLSHSKSAMISYLASLLLTIPAVLYYSHYFDETDDRDQNRSGVFKGDRWVAWTHLLILLNGAFGPVLHLLSDDLLCGLGLEMLTEVCDSIYAATNIFDIGEVGSQQPHTHKISKDGSQPEVKGIENIGFEDKDDTPE